MLRVSGIQEIRRAGEEIKARGSKLMAEMSAMMTRLTERVGPLAVEEMKRATPVSGEGHSAFRLPGGMVLQEWHNRPGTLRDSTRYLVEYGQDGTTVVLIQDAKTEPDESGRWGDVFYGNIVRRGRGPVWPVYKRALAGAGFGPVTHAGPADPDDYPKKAAPGILEISAALARAEARQTAREVMGRG